MQKLIAFFLKNSLLGNFILILVLAGGVYFWQHTSKEQMPSVSFDTLRVSAVYSGATPAEVEYFVTKPIEDAVKGLEGIYRVTSTSGSGSSTVIIEILPGLSDKETVINDIKNAVMDVRLPDEITDPPVVRQFKTSMMAVIDVAVVNTNCRMLDENERRKLQNFALTLENRLLSAPEINSISRSGYRREELQVNLLPEKLRAYNIPLSAITSKIKAHNIRQPAGSMEDKDESKVTISSTLYTREALKNLPIQGGFEGQFVRLGDIAEISNTYVKTKSITAINGYEGMILNVVKNSSTGILTAVDRIKEIVQDFEKNNLSGTPYAVYMIEDESTDVRNRISIIAGNGLLGFILILTFLFIFLDVKSGLWVALGIPFTFCATMIITSAMGYTINNITLSAVIIVMGMIVDDAIIVTENICRLEDKGVPQAEACLTGTGAMFIPVLGSITTTMVAFLPLLAMKGRFARMIVFIPPIIMIMLSASLWECLFMLPGHMSLRLPQWVHNIFSHRHKKSGSKHTEHWFMIWETRYGKILAKVLQHRIYLLVLFLFLPFFIGRHFLTKMKYVMFPNEESTEIRFQATAPAGTLKQQTAVYAQKLNVVLKPYLGREITAYRMQIAMNRWGGAVEENKLMCSIELVSKEKRKKSLNQLITEWETKMHDIPEFTEIRFFKQRFGHSSGTPLEITLLDNNDTVREKAAEELLKVMLADPLLNNPEIAEIPKNPEYLIKVNNDETIRLGIDATRIPSTVRTALDGTILYEIPQNDETIDLRLSVKAADKNNINKILDIPVENKSSYLVPLKNIVSLAKGIAPSSIAREEYKRTLKIYSDIKEVAKNSGLKKPDKSESVSVSKSGSKITAKNSVNKDKADSSSPRASGQQKKPSAPASSVVKKQYVKTPIETADRYEKNVFPQLLKKYPTLRIRFDGEVKETRESQGDILTAVLIVLFLIYMILALILNSVSQPLVIMLSIPFGLAGVILAFMMHGMTMYGFFAVIGMLGLAGVVVNDSIVMLTKLNEEFEAYKGRISLKQIAETAQTRLRAVMLTTLTTVAGLFPTAYGVMGYDSMLAEMMLALGWGLMFGTFITLFLVPSIYSFLLEIKYFFNPPGANA